MTALQPPPFREIAWPFSRPVLMAGLRRYLVAPRLRLLDIVPVALPDTLPGNPSDSITTISGMAVGVEIDGQVRQLPLVLKEAPVSEDGRILSVVGRREYEVYRRLAPHLPLLVPGLVAGDPAQGWIVVEALAGLRPADEWAAEDYREALTNLAALHDRFWGLDEDLAIFPWLGRPFEADYQATIMAAAEALLLLLREERIPALVSRRNFLAFGALVQHADEIAAPLREETHTLLHGDYWPGNIGCPVEGRQIVFDWQRAGIGPAILDLQMFILTTAVMLEPPPFLPDLVALYREEMAWRVAPGWDEERFALLWDHALLWHFLTYWLRRLATISPESYAEFAPGFERLWLAPMLEALGRRMGVQLPE